MTLSLFLIVVDVVIFAASAAAAASVATDVLSMYFMGVCVYMCVCYFFFKYC